jgi:hypothetical protein
MMNKLPGLAATVCATVCAALALSLPAQAAQYSFSYIASGANLSVSGLFTTADASNSLHGYAITGISGSFSDGADKHAISGLADISGRFDDRSSASTRDNVFFPGSELSAVSIVFTVDGDKNKKVWKLWGNAPTDGSTGHHGGHESNKSDDGFSDHLSSRGDVGGNLAYAYLGKDREWTARGGMLSISAVVPEVDSYAMLLVGLGMIGFVGRRRRWPRA